MTERLIGLCNDYLNTVLAEVRVRCEALLALKSLSLFVLE